ncbi:MAG: flagellar motor switch protein FliN [Actinomycetia bacterium]|nr:flagellar motor switch protein FliN [Actinomycetes bacterium]
MSRGTNADLDQVVSSSIAAAAAEAGLQADPAFSDADLPAAAGPFVTMNVLDDDGTTIIACIAVRDSLSSSDELLERLANATATTVGASGGPAPAGPVGTGADLSLRFSMPVKTTALTDGREVQALIIAPIERRTGEVPGAEPAPDPGDARAAREAMATGGNTSGATLSALSGEAGLVGSLDKLVNVGLDVSVELGRTSVTLAEVLEYDVGSVIELDRAAGAPVDVRVNGMLLAQGEVVLIDDEYAVRITAIFDPQADR